MSAFDAALARRDFPILGSSAHGKPLVFLDTAASAQKPRAVIDAVSHCYEAEYANIHRGVYYLSQRATEVYEGARETVAHFLGGDDPNEVVFVRNATEAINLVAQSFGRAFLKEGDEVLLTEMEHHANIVPWQMLRDAVGVTLKVVPFDEAGDIALEAFEEAITPSVKLVAVTHMSNALGTVLPVKEIARLAKAKGAKVLIDGCQAVPHMKVDVADIDCDFYAFSSHKLYGPTGIGVLWARRALLDAMPPYQGGGDMIRSVTFERTVFAEPPHKFEAGTPHIAGAAGLVAAIRYLEQFDFAAIGRHEMALHDIARDGLSAINRVRIYGSARHKGAILSFGLEGVHPHDVGTILDREGVAVRGGHHCAQPVMAHYKIPGTTRASFGLYNTEEDAMSLVAGVKTVLGIFG